MLETSTLIAVGSNFVTVVSIAVSILIYLDSQQLKRELKTFDWERVTTGARELGKSISRKTKPDLVLAFTPRSGIIAFLVREHISPSIPLLIGCVYHKSDYSGGKMMPQTPIGFSRFETSKMFIDFPSAVSEGPYRKILLVDEYAITGDALFESKQYLKRTSNKDILTAALVVSSAAEISKKAPDFFVYRTDSSDFYMPWGKAA